MMSDEFFCNACSKIFDMPRFYYESHGFKYPPYERIAVCPFCSSDDFVKVETKIEKIDVAEKVLYVILLLNRFCEKLENVFCAKFKNCDLCDSIEILSEFIVEMFDFLDSDMQKEILNLNCEKCLEKIFTKLRGE